VLEGAAVVDGVEVALAWETGVSVLVVGR